MKYEQVPISSPEIRAEARALADDLLTFLDASPANAFAVAELQSMLDEAGFEELSESEPFDIEHGGAYYLKRHDSALVAFVVGDLAPSVAGFRMIAAHTDSPGFKLKPCPEKVDHGVVHLGVEVYGGPTRVTWMDRDLGICGLVHVARRGGIETMRYRSGAPIVCLPNVAIHQNREANDKGLKVNPQTELRVILGTLAEGLPEEGAVRWLLAQALDVDADAILDFDLFLYDTQPASYGGFDREFIRSGRLDDLTMVHASMTALVDTSERSTPFTRVAVAYDAEEVGSRTTQGAQSSLVPSVLERIAIALGDDREGYHAALAQSFLISADNAHAVHPGYSSKMEPDHAPVINGGPVIKGHASRAYATDGYSASVFELACRKAASPVQRFVNRSDVRSGGTIGSMTAAQLGVRTVDVGNPQYAMHSVREMAGTWDHWYMAEAMRAYYTG